MFLVNFHKYIIIVRNRNEMQNQPINITKNERYVISSYYVQEITKDVARSSIYPALCRYFYLSFYNNTCVRKQPRRTIAYCENISTQNKQLQHKNKLKGKLSTKI